MKTINLENIKAIGSGCHDGPEDGMCVMEACAYVTGEPWSDHPQCVCPVIAQFMRTWNDDLPDDETRTRLLLPLIPDLVKTRSTHEVEQRRSWMALDWLAREHAPAFLDLVEILRPHATALRALSPITDADAAKNALNQLDAARDAARDAERAAAWAAVWDAAGDAAGDAVWDAAGNAAGSAAGNAARDAAGDAAWDAAGDAAGDAARDAARDAAGDAAWNAAGNAAGNAAWEAAWDAARDALAPTVSLLQASAIELVRRMIAVEAKGGA